MNDANLDLALRAVLFGAVGTAGQRCTTTRRLFLQRGIAARMTDGAGRRLPAGPDRQPARRSHAHGPAGQPRARGRHAGGLRGIREQGGEILYGGERLGGCFVRTHPGARRGPTCPSCSEEIFAPILYLIEFDELDEAIDWHNDVPQGLSSAMFTTNLISAETFLSAPRQRLRHRQRQHRHQRRRNRRRVRRRKGNRRRPRSRQRLLEGLHAPPDQHHQLVERAAARAGHQISALTAAQPVSASTTIQ